VEAAELVGSPSLAFPGCTPTKEPPLGNESIGDERVGIALSEASVKPTLGELGPRRHSVDLSESSSKRRSVRSTARDCAAVLRARARFRSFSLRESAAEAQITAAEEPEAAQESSGGRATAWTPVPGALPLRRMECSWTDAAEAPVPVPAYGRSGPAHGAPMERALRTPPTYPSACAVQLELPQQAPVRHVLQGTQVVMSAATAPCNNNGVEYAATAPLTASCAPAPAPAMSTPLRPVAAPPASSPAAMFWASPTWDDDAGPKPKNNAWDDDEGPSSITRTRTHIQHINTLPVPAFNGRTNQADPASLSLAARSAVDRARSRKQGMLGGEEEPALPSTTVDSSRASTTPNVDLWT